ncbi:hypothetical protein BTJ40_01795 [Microbulbifer sp. A4B17]|nr:hypothetical protein BTJ40_01795 [Microbulbifer sp. A4B17]
MCEALAELLSAIGYRFHCFSIVSFKVSIYYLAKLKIRTANHITPLVFIADGFEACLQSIMNLYLQFLRDIRCLL